MTNAAIKFALWFFTMKRRHIIGHLLLWIGTLALLWTSAPVNASLSSFEFAESAPSAEKASAASSGCGHQDAAPIDENNDDEDCDDNLSVSCVTCKCTGPAAFTLSGDVSSGRFAVLQTKGATRPVKPSLDPPRI